MAPIAGDKRARKPCDIVAVPHRIAHLAVRAHVDVTDIAIASGGKLSL